MTRLIDLTSDAAEFNADPYPLYAKLRAQGPVHRVRSEAGEQWLVVGYEAAKEALTDPRFRKNRPRPSATDSGISPIDKNLLETDPPDHTRLRKLVTREFTGRRIAALEPRIQELTDELVDELTAKSAGRADLVDALAFPLPMTVICELLGVPDLDRDAFRGWSNDFVAPEGPDSMTKAIHAIEAYLIELIAAKAKTPGDDLMSALIRTRDEEGDRLSRDELIAMAFLLLVAGQETTANLISGGLLCLLRHPDQLAALRADMRLLDSAIEEILRYEGPVENSTFRYTATDTSFRGTVIPADSTVRVVFASADRDPAKFAAPDTFDIRRSTQGHLAFGHGVHYCIGAPLGRLEAKVAIGTLLRRCPKLALDTAPEALEWRPGLLIRGVRRLPVRW
ncbi:cytochrome P450 [Streptomyces sp. NRRL B-1140]|uniref:cytochrome P450 family protein n=1 Tax=Streptomyces sp. NRRL B-1140 TaxID=1415549 RepID=UPI0006AE9FE9|nr:cytochrome P450 [Streptomyces sp. NRRL B-1140]KOX06483.1 cytochrome P450 [Streptomyces sp. NRRL B-1140]